ncbi:MAG: hypothetical protein NUV63_14040 [Gallionella sp.]|nr:hypothetical protein [Gallionella sp.]
MADSRPAIAVSITALAIIASCATSTGQARWMSCEVEEVGAIHISILREC